MTSTPAERSRALIELIFAGVLWGFGFIGTVWCLQFLSPAAILSYRFGMAFLASLIILIFRKVPLAILKNELRLAFVPALILWLCLMTQTFGLKYTTATNSTFITTLYVVIVPLLHSLSGQEKLHWLHWFCVFLALLGTGFIVQVQDLSELNWGDLLTLICALFAALHILLIGQRALNTQNDFALNAFQAFWICLFSLLFFPFSEKWDLSVLNDKGWIGLFVLCFGSLIAFYLQVRSQKILSPSVVSLLFLLESPAACLFAYWLLNEQLSSWQWLGAGLILVACGLISLKTEAVEHSV